MKKNLLPVMVLLMAAMSAFGQRNLKGSNGVDLQAGISKYGQAVFINYRYFFNKHFYIRAAALYAQDKDPNMTQIAHSSMGVDALAGYSFSIDRRRTFFIHLIAGGTTVYDQMISGRNNLSASAATTEMKYGGVGGLELEYYVWRDFSIIVNGNQRILSGNVFGSNRYYATFGVRYNFYRRK